MHQATSQISSLFTSPVNVTLACALCRGLSESDRGGSPRQRGPRGATWLPSRYRLQRVHVQRQAGLRWADEFDFSFYNRTRFAGLENGVANCYVNSLVQASVHAQLHAHAAYNKTMCCSCVWPSKQTVPVLRCIPTHCFCHALQWLRHSQGHCLKWCTALHGAEAAAKHRVTR